MFEQDVAGELASNSEDLSKLTLCSATGLIKALRANKNDEGVVVQRALDETRKEIKSKDVDIKAAAVLKLVYVSCSHCASKPSPLTLGSSNSSRCWDTQSPSLLLLSSSV